jgi:hypothetical protein
MARPDGSHDKLPAEQAAAIDRTLEYYGLKPLPRRRPWWQPTGIRLAVLIGLAVWIMAMGCALFIRTHDQGAQPFVVVVTPTTYGAPGPAGGVR